VEDKFDYKTVLSVIDMSTLLSIAIISVFVSLLSLVIPIAAQTLVNMIAFVKLLQPVFVISFVVFVIMIGAGVLNIWQKIVIEVLQQKLFVNISLDLTYRIPRLHLKSLDKYHGPELADRFFDLMVVEKSIAKLLVYGINISLQIVIGMFLLLIYHPILMGFDLLLLLGLGLTLYFPYRKALDSAYDECMIKHQVATWLEGIMHHALFFKLGKHSNFAIQQMDTLLVDYLRVRNQHCKMLIAHGSGLYALSAIAASLLLGIGGYLVIKNQLSLGQLVAAEIVVGGLIYAFAQLGTLLSDYYDLRASLAKVDTLLALPNEVPPQTKGLNTLPLSQASLTLDFINFQVNSSMTPAHKKASPDDPLLIFGGNGRGKSNWINVLLGISTDYAGEIKINGIEGSPNLFFELREKIALLRKTNIFIGTIYENLVLSDSTIELRTIYAVLDALGLADKIAALPKDIHTPLTENESLFTRSEQEKLMFARAILSKPELFLIDAGFDNMDDDSIERILSLLFKQENMTLIVTSNRENLLIHFPNHVML
jgi:ABC-type bacteriocin/lantibiotic exporter with double-glycine peptidase domain